MHKLGTEKVRFRPKADIHKESVTRLEIAKNRR